MAFNTQTKIAKITLQKFTVGGDFFLALGAEIGVDMINNCLIIAAFGQINKPNESPSPVEIRKCPGMDFIEQLLAKWMFTHD